jgi:GH24 family phage-related lysozyme (muramidase)
MQQSVRDNFLDFTTKFEGRVEWMYLDIKGLVSIGIGNLIDPINLAMDLPFVHKDDINVAASTDEIEAEWQTVKGRQDLAPRGHLAFKDLTSLQMTDDSIDELVFTKLDQFQSTLENTTEFADLEDWPSDAQLGLFSMAWAMGPAFGPGFPHFRAACTDHDWAGAAAQCHMEDSANPGLRPRNKADVVLFTNAQAVVDQGLDFSVLQWPTALAPASVSA